MTDLAPRPDTIEFEVLGESGPFSRTGRSISYRLVAGDRDILLDCGAPVFAQLGWEGVRQIDAVIGTHSHSDHKRWLTDIALFQHYVAGLGRPLKLLSHDPILEELEQAVRPALERSLTMNSDRVLACSWRQFIEPVAIGPRARYRIESADGPARWRVVDLAGAPVPAGRAKVVLPAGDDRAAPRLLFRDPGSDAWVEPDSYYPFTASAFYEDDPRDHVDASGLRLRAIKSTAWHGPLTISVLVTRGAEQVLFTSDTAYDPRLWRRLTEERLQPTRGGMAVDEFERAALLRGDINDFLERSWSPERLTEAERLLGSCPVVHDVAGKDSIVHTDYANLPVGLAPELLLTHSPDHFVSREPIAATRRTLVVSGGIFRERVGARDWPLDADVYVRDNDEFLVGYAHDDGGHRVIEKDGVLDVIAAHETTRYPVLETVELFADIGGRYLPRLGDPHQRYEVRPDGAIERVTYSERGSLGVVQQDLRPQLARTPASDPA